MWGKKFSAASTTKLDESSPGSLRGREQGVRIRSVYLCGCGCELKEHILSHFAGEKRKCLYPSGTTNQATVLYSDSSFSVSLSLFLSLYASLSLSFFFFFTVKAHISESKLEFLRGFDKVFLTLLPLV